MVYDQIIRGTVGSTRHPSLDGYGIKRTRHAVCMCFISKLLKRSNAHHHNTRLDSWSHCDMEAAELLIIIKEARLIPGTLKGKMDHHPSG